MLSLHTNAASLSTQNSLSVNNKNLTSSMSKLGTGLRVNSAMDDAAGLQIATRLNAQSRGMQVAQKNTQNGISMLQTAEGSMSEINNMLLRMKDLATESANGTSSQADRDALQAEYSALGLEISNILKNTTFAGQKLFSGEDDIGDAGSLSAAGAFGDTNGITFHVGASKDETVKFTPNATDGSLQKLMDALSEVSGKIGKEATPGTAGTAPTDKGLKPSAEVLHFFKGLDETEIGNLSFATDVTTNGTAATKALFPTEADFENAQAWAVYQYKLDTSTGPSEINSADQQTNPAASMIEKLETAINAVGTFRSDLGAVANRLDHTFNNLSNMITNTETAKGRIMDVDYATETSNMTKNQMLMQASSAMLKQSNSMSQMVSSLLQ